MLAEIRRLPSVKFKAGDRATLDRPKCGAWPTSSKQKVAMETVEVEIIELRHEPYWQYQADGTHAAQPAIYLTRVVATGEEFHASQASLVRKR